MESKEVKKQKKEVIKAAINKFQEQAEAAGAEEAAEEAAEEEAPAEEKTEEKAEEQNEEKAEEAVTHEPAAEEDAAVAAGEALMETDQAEGELASPQSTASTFDSIPVHEAPLEC